MWGRFQVCSIVLSVLKLLCVPVCWQIRGRRPCTARLTAASCGAPPWWWRGAPCRCCPPPAGWTPCWSSKCSRQCAGTPARPGPTWWSGCCSRPPPPRCCRWWARCAPPRSSGTGTGWSSCPRCPDRPGRFCALNWKLINWQYNSIETNCGGDHATYSTSSSCKQLDGIIPLFQYWPWSSRMCRQTIQCRYLQ